MLQSAITIVFPILYIFQKYYQDYQQIACMGAIPVEGSKSKIVHENPMETERSDYTEKCVYNMPSVNYGDTKLFPPPISCLSLLNAGRRLSYYKLYMNDASFSEEEVIVPDRGIMSCLRHNGYLKMWFPLRPGVGGQPHQEGDDDEDDDSSDDSSSSESDYYYTTSDEDSDDDDSGSDSDIPDYLVEEPIDDDDDNNNSEDYRNDIGDDREGNANNEEGNENSTNSNTS